MLCDLWVPGRWDADDVRFWSVRVFVYSRGVDLISRNARRGKKEEILVALLCSDF